MGTAIRGRANRTGPEEGQDGLEVRARCPAEEAGKRYRANQYSHIITQLVNTQLLWSNCN
jgi:hypothetical protein